MKKIQLINDDYLGHADVVRHACRGVVMRDGKVLLSCEAKFDKYMIPGGGVEDNETLAECCEREVLEETGFEVKAIEEYLEVEELFENWQHFNHFFICEFVRDTGCQHLTEGEKDADYKPVWMPLQDALDFFGRYEEYHQTNIADYGLYKRELIALEEYCKVTKD